MDRPSTNENIKYEKTSNIGKYGLFSLLNNAFNLLTCNKSCIKLPNKSVSCSRQERDCVSKTNRLELLACGESVIYAYPITTADFGILSTTLTNLYPYYSPTYQKCTDVCDGVYPLPANGAIFFEKGGNFIIRPKVKSVGWQAFPIPYVPNNIVLTLYITNNSTLPPTTYANATIPIAGPFSGAPPPSFNTGKSYNPQFAISPNAANPLSFFPIDIPPNSTYYFTLGVSVSFFTAPDPTSVISSLYSIITLEDFDLEITQVPV